MLEIHVNFVIFIVRASGGGGGGGRSGYNSDLAYIYFLSCGMAVLSFDKWLMAYD